MASISSNSFNESDIRPSELMDEQAKRLAADIKRLLKHKSDFIQVNCPACNCCESNFLFEKYGIEFVICKACETIYANPRPKPEHLEEYYCNSENYAYWNQYIFPASEAARREKIFKPRVQKVIDICQKYQVCTNTILEVGAGFGIFCEEVKKTNVFRRIIGVEPTPDLANTCRKRGIEVIEKPIENVVFENIKIDVIVNFEVIEHLFNPKDFLGKCYQLLVPGGILIITCPNSKGFDIATLAEKSSAVDNEHLNLFNTESLTLLMQSCQFEVLETQTPGRLDAELVRNQVISGNYNLKGQAFLQKVLVDSWNTLGKAFQDFLVDSKLSSNMLIVARKPLLAST